ncbi:hypothetical protein QJS10_CPB13g01642 [Acorus calamus]|uniref:BACK domain-containing protein n=1 Tax=Acorus calamus TaxID=4465 RepID=A0AAV9DHJ7_ACOCL|nr:hypothetical protein QJS10_CPB13g01642 [Acorus calamus]
MSTIAEGGFIHQISIDTVIEIWNYCMEHSIGSVSELCKSYIARNFAWAISSRSFIDVPYSCLRACLEDPQLTVDSEKQLCEGLLEWLASNAKSWEKIDLSGCAHISVAFLVTSIFLSSTDADATSTEILREFLSKLDGCHGRQMPILAKSFS